MEQEMEQEMTVHPWQQAGTLLFLSDHPLTIYRQDVCLLSSCWQLTSRQVRCTLETMIPY